MNLPAPVTSIETLPTELLEWLGERKIKPGDGDLWVRTLPKPDSRLARKKKVIKVMLTCSSTTPCTGLR